MLYNENQERGGALNLFSTGLGLMPLALGMGVAYGRLNKAGEAINPLNITNTSSQTLGKEVSLGSRRKQRDMKEAGEKVRQRLSQSLQQNNAVQEMANQLKSHNALYHVLSVTLEDPSLGLDTAQVQSLRSTLSSLGENLAQDQQEIVQKMIRTIAETASDEALVNFEKNITTYRKISSQIVPPTVGIGTTNQPFNKIVGRQGLQNAIGSVSKDKAVQKRIMERFGRLEGGLSAQGWQIGDIFAENLNGINQIYVQVKSGRSFVANVPLLNSGIYRPGQALNTLYTAPRFSINSRAASMSNAKSRAELINTGAMSGWADQFIDDLFNRAPTMGGRAFREYKSRELSVVPRAFAARGDARLNRYGRHVLKQKQNEMHVAQLSNLGVLGDEGIALTARLSTLPGFGVNRKGMVGGFGEDRVGFVSLQGGVIQALENTYGLGRGDIPLGAREYQITHRTDAFVTNNKTINMPGGRSFMFGGLLNLEEQAARAASFGLGDSVSGAAVKMAVLVGNKNTPIYQNYVDSGQGFTGSAHRLLEGGSLTVLRPEEHKLQSTRALEMIRAAGDEGVFFKWEDWKDGIALGETAAGPKVQRPKQGSYGIRIGIEQRADPHGKALLHLWTVEERKQDEAQKVFSLSAKGNEKVVRNEMALKRLLGDMGGQVEQELGGIGMKLKDTSIWTMEYAKKGAGIAARQGALVGTFWAGLSDAAIKTRAQGLNLETFGYNGKNSNAMRVLLATTQLMMEKGASQSHIGMAMASMYTYADTHLGKGGAEFLEKYASGIGSDALTAMQRKVMILPEVFSPGTGTGDYRTGNTSMEPRQAKGLVTKLVRSGLDVNQASKVVGGLYRNSMGINKKIGFALGIEDMVRSASGTLGLEHLRKQGIHRIGFEEARTLGLKKGGLAELAKQHSGLMVDFSDAPSSVREVIRSTMGTHEILLAGKEAFQSSRGVEIKQSGGKASLAIGGEIEEIVNSFGGTLNQMVNNPEGAVDSLQAWRNKVFNLEGNVVSSLMKGKLIGSASPIAQVYSLNSQADLNARQFSRAWQIAEQTDFNAVFSNAEGFLSELYDMKGSSSWSNMDLAQKAEMFFTEMEITNQQKKAQGLATPFRGVAGIAYRNPALSQENIFLSQKFRKLEEVTALGGRDEFFERFKASETGQRILSTVFGNEGTSNISSFADIRNKDQKRQFFLEFIKNLEQFTSGQGGGTQHTLRYMVGDVDLGPGLSAFLDQDGDTLAWVNLTKDQVKQVRGVMNSLNETKGRMFFSSILDQVKEGIGNYGAQMPPPDPNMALYEGVLKEVGLDIGTGRLDTALRPLHDAAFDYGVDNPNARNLRTFLGALQESAIIKAKKLERYTQLPDMLVAAFSNAYQTGDTAGLESLIKNDIFHGTQLGQGQKIKLSMSQGMQGLPQEEQQRLIRMGMNLDMEYSLDDLFESMRGLIAQSRAQGTHQLMTAQQIAKRLNESPGETIDNILAGVDVNTSILAESRGPMSPENMAASTRRGIRSLKAAIGNIDMKAMGPIGMGVVGSVGAMMMMGQQGYSPEPLVAPGESVSPRVQEGMTMGNLFSYNNEAPGLNELQQQSAESAIINRQIHQGVTHFQKPNSFQVRGEVNGLSGMSEVRTLLNNFGNTNGSIVVNDQRRPITAAYVNRLMGEY